MSAKGGGNIGGSNEAETIMDPFPEICCDSWGRKESDATERLNWTELNGIVIGDFPDASTVKNPPAIQEPQETWIQSVGQDDSLKEGMQSIPGFLPGAGKLHSIGLQRDMTAVSERIPLQQ